MNGKKSILIVLGVVVLLLAITVPLQYLVRREVVVGLSSESAHSHAHGEEGHEHAGEEDQQGAGVPLGSNLISNYGFEVGTREQIWGWGRTGENQEAVIFRDDTVAHLGFASASVSAGGNFVRDAGWFMKLGELPRNHDVIFEGYVKTKELRGNAYLRILAEGSMEGQEEAALVISASTDDVNGESDWTLSSLRCFIPPEATGVWLEVGVYGSGQAWFDDLSLVVEEREDVMAAGENLLENPSLEEGARGWHYDGSIANPVLDYGNYSTGPDGGKAFLIRDNTPVTVDSNYLQFSQSICCLYGKKGTLSVSGWLRAEDLSGSGFLGLRVFKADGSIIYRSETVVSGQSPWTRCEMQIPLDGDIASVWISIVLQGPGGLEVSGLEATFQEQQ